MRTHNRDTETLIAALQSDLPTAEDDARMRALLASAGACVGASVASAVALKATSAAGAPGVVLGSATLKGASAAAGAKVGGVFSTLTAALPFGGVKTLVIAGAIATGASYPVLAPKLSAVFNPVGDAQPVVAPLAGTLPVVDAKTQVTAGSAVVDANKSVGSTAVVPLGTQGSTERGASGIRLSVEAPNGERQSNSKWTVEGSRSASSAARGVASSETPDARQGAGSVSDALVKPSTPFVQQPTASRVGDTSFVVGNVLADETLLIERALRAQRSGDKASARSWLAVHEQRFPNGKLTIERNRMRAQLQD